MKFFALLLAFTALSAGDDPEQILQQIKHTVAEQLSKTANYACTETLVRSYFRPIGPISAACQTSSPAADRKQFARDQLRLDVAVAKEELYSWHGENNFSSKRISDIVDTGPISSGGFVGYLQNIFLGKGIRFTYTGISSSEERKEFGFTFSVPKMSSEYSILTGNKFEVVPFHGAFSATTDNFELLSLTVIPEDIPFGSNICSVETEVHYQLAPISGRAALIPDSFDLRIDDDQHVYTVSRGQYRDCHEFRAESALRFDYSDSIPRGTVASTVQEHLPPGIKMRLSLAAPLNDERNYAGDPIDAILLEPIKIPGSGEVIPRGTRVHGVITRFESRFEPSDHFFLKIVFERITYGNRTYVLYAVHKPTGKEMDKITFLFGGILPKAIMAQLNDGVIIIAGKHLNLDQRYKGDWETAAAPTVRDTEVQSAR